MKIAQKVATANDRQVSIRLDKSVQHLDIVRYAPLCALLAGLEDGFPELVSSEISHSIRGRVRPLDRVPLYALALWGQHGKGPMLEEAASVLRDKHYAGGSSVAYLTPENRPSDEDLADKGQAGEVAAAALYALHFRIYLNDQGPTEVVAEDHYTLEFTNLIQGSRYDFYAAEVPVLAAYANSYTKFEPRKILADDREEVIAVGGKSGIILPNVPGIERVLIVFRRDGQLKDSKELVLPELLATQTVVNPNIMQLQYEGPTVKDISTHFMDSQDAGFFVIDFGVVDSIQIDNTLGQELNYILISQQSRD